MKQDYTKIKAHIRGWLLGREWFLALDAMNFAAEFHTGLRKDGLTPEFEHQVSQAQYTRTMIPNLLHPEETMAVNFLHDVQEDYGVTREEINRRFGPLVDRGTWRMTKVFGDIKKTPEVYFGEMAKCPMASVAKGVDRIHNNGTMLGVFTRKGLEHYLKENNEMIVPMLKKAKRNFPRQEGAYEALKHMIQMQSHMVSKFLEIYPKDAK